MNFTTQPPAPIQTTPSNISSETTTIAPSYVVFSEYSTQRLTCSQPEKKTVPNTGLSAKPPSAEQNYHNIPLMYNYGQPVENKSLNDFQLEVPEVTTTHGIRTSSNSQTGRLESSVMVRFDVNNPEHARFLEVMKEIHGGCAHIVAAYKGAVKMPHFNPTMAVATGFKDPIHRPFDEVTGQPIEGRAPTIFFKLYSRGKPPFVEQTMFTGLDGKPIPWTVLQNVEMRFIPLMHFKRIYVGGGKISLQIEMLSAVVTYIKGRGTSSAQTATITRLQQSRPDLSDTVAAQLAKITAERQELLLAGSLVESSTAPTNSTESQPSFAGIAPGRNNSNDQLPPPGNLPNIGNIPNLPALGAGQQSMADFTAGAPQRPVSLN